MIELIKKAFLKDHNRYLSLLDVYYPAHGETGFTERNLSHNFIVSLEQVLGSGCISWFEAPVDLDNNGHIDAVVFDTDRKVSFLIESKRFTSKSKIQTVRDDIKRMCSKEHIKLLENGLYDTDIEKRYAIVLADVWTETVAKKEILASWPNCVFGEDVLFSMSANFESLKTKEDWKYNYNLLIAMQEIII